jgi:nicotinamide-nucleotide amidase
MEAAIKRMMEEAREKGIKIVTVESCTGGLIGKLLTDQPGASHVYERGYITYSNEGKSDLVDVPPSLLKQHGAVSEQVAIAMAEGALHRTPTQLSVSVTGIAGPDGGSAEKPVGLVYIGIAVKEGPAKCVKCQFSGSRAEIRQKGAEKAIQMLMEAVHDYRLSA